MPPFLDLQKVVGLRMFFDKDGKIKCGALLRSFGAVREWKKKEGKGPDLVNSTLGWKELRKYADERQIIEEFAELRLEY